MAGATLPWVGQWLARGEIAAKFDEASYTNGLNGDFLGDLDADAMIAKYAGAPSAPGGAPGGGGRFEDAEDRDIAANIDGIVRMLEEHCGLGPSKVRRRLSVCAGAHLAQHTFPSKLALLNPSPDHVPLRRWLIPSGINEYRCRRHGSWK